MDETQNTEELKQQLMADGHAAFDAEDFTRALDFYHRAALLDTNDASVWTAIGLTFSNLDFPREAWRSFLLALNMDSSDANALWYAAEFLFEIEDLPLADLFLGHYLNVEQDEEKLAEARQMRDEIHTEAKARGVVMEQSRGAAAEEMLEGKRGDENVASIESDQEEESTDEPDESEEFALDEEELEQIALAGGRFTPPLALRLTGFEGICQHCNLQMPLDAPYCWSCKMIHFYD